MFLLLFIFLCILSMNWSPENATRNLRRTRHPMDNRTTKQKTVAAQHNSTNSSSGTVVHSNHNNGARNGNRNGSGNPLSSPPSSGSSPDALALRQFEANSSMLAELAAERYRKAVLESGNGTYSENGEYNINESGNGNGNRNSNKHTKMGTRAGDTEEEDGDDGHQDQDGLLGNGVAAGKEISACTHGIAGSSKDLDSGCTKIMI